MKFLLKSLLLDLLKSAIIAIWFYSLNIGDLSILQWIAVFVSISIFLGFNIREV